MKKIAIFGASSFAREVADICHDLGIKEMVFVSDYDDIEQVDGIRVLKTGDIEGLQADGYQFAIGIGASNIRQKVFNEFPNLPYPNLVHPTVTFGRNQRDALQAAKGNILAAGVRVSNQISFGDFGVFNLNSVIGHDCTLGNFVSIMTGSLISGNVTIGEGVYMGCGACIINGTADNKVIIGKGATIGMGSVVIRNVDDESKVFGNPARPRP